MRCSLDQARRRASCRIVVVYGARRWWVGRADGRLSEFGDALSARMAYLEMRRLALLAGEEQDHGGGPWR